MIEKSISEQIDFFHLNLVSSSMVIKVDFDLTMSILAHNPYRLFALELGRYANLSVQSLYDKFVLKGANIQIGDKTITVKIYVHFHNYYFFRVERIVTSPLPHRPVRAAFPHTVPLKSVSLLKMSDKSWGEPKEAT